MNPAEVRILLERLSPDLDGMAEPWSLIGSGALILLGVPLSGAADLDVVTSAAGARHLRTAWVAWLRPGRLKPPDGPFRSDDFARYETPWGPVEVMGRLRVRGEPLVIADREPDRPIPTAVEQLRILRLFGRPKDLAKAAALEAWMG